MKVLIYDNSYHLISSTVKYILPVINLFSQKHNIVLLGDRRFDIKNLTYHHDINTKNIDCMYLNFKQSNIPLLSYKSHIKKCMEVSRISKEYDIFINNSFDDNWQIEPLSSHNMAVIYNTINPYRRWQKKERLKKLKNYFRERFFGPAGSYIFIGKYEKVFVISEFVGKFIKNIWNINKLNVIYPWIDSMAKTETAQKNDIILSVTRLLPGKPLNLDKMINAFRDIYKAEGSTWALHIALNVKRLEMGHSFSYIEKQKKLANGLPVYFHINLDKPRLSKLYGISKIFWSFRGFEVKEEERPELCEPFGINAVEAMKNLCVPIAPHNGGIREIIENNVSGYLAATTEQLIHKTIKLIKNPETLSLMAQNAFKRSLFFSKERFTYQFNEQIKELL